MKTQSKFFYYNTDEWCYIFRLPDDTIKYLWKQIENAKQKKNSYKDRLVGVVHSSLALDDPDQLFANKIIPTTLAQTPQRYAKHPQRLIEKAYSTFFTSTERLGLLHSIPKFKTESWVNFQRKYEYNPVHFHAGLLSYVVWMRIPYDHENEKRLPFSRDVGSTKTVYENESHLIQSAGQSKAESIGNFCFVSKEYNQHHTVIMNKGMEGMCTIFPASFSHTVYPFYTSDEERVTIAGNAFIKLE